MCVLPYGRCQFGAHGPDWNLGAELRHAGKKDAFSKQEGQALGQSDLAHEDFELETMEKGALGLHCI